MTVDEVRELAFEIIPCIGNLLNLGQWEIAITVEDEDPEELGYQAIVQAYDEYEKAHITIYADNIEDIETLIEVLVHEMVHVLISTVFRMNEMTDGLGQLLNYASEKTTLRVERALHKLGIKEKVTSCIRGGDTDEAEFGGDDK